MNAHIQLFLQACLFYGMSTANLDKLVNAQPLLNSYFGAHYDVYTQASRLCCWLVDKREVKPELIEYLEINGELDRTGLGS